MKIFNPEDYQIFLTDENIGKLIEMKNFYPPLKEWLKIKEILPSLLSIIKWSKNDWK